MDNYEFCVDWVSQREQSSDFRVLDYGCGSGDIVKRLLGININAFGCDVFYEGGNLSSLVDTKLVDNGIIRKMDSNTIPFDSAIFDIVINNQVMEHVQDIDSVLDEISRVLKPGGVVLSLFPDKGVWREGHCGIPFLHWFPKYSHPRIYYATLLRSLGLGHHKGNKSAFQWSSDFCQWLDNWTYYRTQREIEKSYSKYFCDIEHIESYWLKKRVNRGQMITAIIPESLNKFIVNKLAGVVMTAYKPSND